MEDFKIMLTHVVDHRSNGMCGCIYEKQGLVSSDAWGLSCCKVPRFSQSIHKCARQGQVMCQAALFADIYVTPVHTAVYRPEEAARLWAE